MLLLGNRPARSQPVEFLDLIGDAEARRLTQSVLHLHCHVVPRTKGDGLRGFFWPRTKYGPGEAEAYADRLRSALA